MVARHPGRYRVFALTANGSAEALLELCRRHRPRYAVLSGVAEDARPAGADSPSCGTELLFGAEALESVARHPETQAVMAGIVGAAGLASTLAAVRAGKRVLLANKEALVMAGPLVMRAARDVGRADAAGRQRAQRGVPVPAADCEGLRAQDHADRLRRPVPLGAGRRAWTRVTPEQACAHPNWVMGRKISVDSATMMNKGLEVIEARWLFDVRARAHRGADPSAEHRAFAGRVRRRLGDRAALQSRHARADRARARLSGAHRVRRAAARPGCDRSLSFEKPDLARFPCLALAYAALRAGGTAPAVLNAANEVAVEAFLAGRLRFTGIAG